LLKTDELKKLASDDKKKIKSIKQDQASNSSNTELKNDKKVLSIKTFNENSDKED
jgi:hypothetical protein